MNKHRSTNDLNHTVLDLVNCSNLGVYEFLESLPLATINQFMFYSIVFSGGHMKFLLMTFVIVEYNFHGVI